jgi:hypothetical protein
MLADGLESINNSPWPKVMCVGHRSKVVVVAASTWRRTKVLVAEQIELEEEATGGLDLSSGIHESAPERRR